MKRVLLVGSLLMISMLACQISGLPTVAPPTPVLQIQATPPVLPTPAGPTEEQTTLEALYQQVLPGVVAIQTGSSLGSGFVIDKDGHIVTNQHVVEGSSEVEVDFASGFKAHGTVIGSDPDGDIAVVQVENAPADQIHPLALGDSSALKVGEQVVAIGNPFGLNGTMTVGIVSALGRTQPAHAAPEGNGFFSNADIIQTDAAINPGNSGGPLFNLKGEVVGINQSIRTDTVNQTTGNAVNSGVGFSISINLVKRVVPFLIRDGKYEYPYLGISSASNLGLAEIEALGLNTYTGAYVTNVTPGGPADKAGIHGGSKPTNIEGLQAGGDIITAIDGHPVDNFDELLSYLTTNKSPGDTVVLTVLRDGKPMDINLTLDKRPQ
ncbi:MAG TPA: trypsin-like peptidase domain-containing protein [Anaerolineales bacterium]|nr:trypsin-like peptidase domain-containing protein [Anaerolineales bacterium]